MERTLLVNKPHGLSPLQTIHLLQQQHPEYQNLKLGYAGRLDPLAKGLLLILVGEENKRKKEYEALPKTYEFEVLFGISTDTYDTLGLITSEPPRSLLPTLLSLEKSVTKLLPSFISKRMQPYPPYSSRTVHGKPLYWYARQNKLSEITIPEREIEIYSLELLSPASRQAGPPLLLITKLEQLVFERINIVRGDFRQHEIRSSWQSFFHSLHTDRQALPRFPVCRFRVSCSSGTYVRSLANDFGKQLGMPSLAYSITRTAIGPHSLKGAINLTP